MGATATATATGTDAILTTIAATGMYVPEATLTSAELEVSLGLSPGWIAARTGVAARRLAAPHEATSDLAIAAGRRALEASGAAPATVDLLILATSTPDHPLPPTAPLVAHGLGLTAAGAFDLAAACSGFLYGLGTARAYIGAGLARRVLLIGANVMSRRLNWRDRDTAVLFGDGAGAVLLEAAPAETEVTPAASAQPGRPRLLATTLGADGSGYPLLQVPGGGSRAPLSHADLDAAADRMRMKGTLLFRHAIRQMGKTLSDCLAAVGLEPAAIDHLIPHQANRRILEAVARELGLPAERILSNIDRYGNTSAASIPILLHEAATGGTLRPGELVALTAFGGGLTSAAALLRW